MDVARLDPEIPDLSLIITPCVTVPPGAGVGRGVGEGEDQPRD